MSVLGNKEKGVISQHQSSNFSIPLPIKKRKFIIFEQPLPTRKEEERPSNSSNDDLKNKQESKSPPHGQSTDTPVNTGLSGDESVLNTNPETNVDTGSPGNKSAVNPIPVTNVDTGSFGNKSAVKTNPGMSVDMGSSGNKSALDADPATNIDTGSSGNKSATNPGMDVDTGNKSASNTNHVSIVKKEKASDEFVDIPKADVEVPISRPLEDARPNDVVNKANLLLNDDKSAGTKDPESSKDALTLNVKTEMVNGEVKGDSKLDLMVESGNLESSVRPVESVIPALKHHPSLEGSQTSGNVDPSSLSLSLSNEKKDIIGSMISNVSRSNWDLNTTMDAWEASVSDDTSVHGTAQIGDLNKTGNRHIVEPASSVPGHSLNTGKQILGGISPSFSNSSVSLGVQNRPEDSLHLSLCTPYRLLDSGGVPSVSSQPDSTSILPDSSLHKNQLSSKNMNSPTCGIVKPEPREEVPNPDRTLAIVSSVDQSKLISVKKELIDSRSQGSELPQSTSCRKLVNSSSIKSELVEGGKGTKEDAVPQSIRKVMQHQESSASSSIVAVPSTPQKSLPSRLTTFSDSSTSGSLSSQSEQASHAKEVRNNNERPDERLSVISDFTSQNDKMPMVKSNKVDDLNVEESEVGKLNRIDELHHESQGNVAADDEEKLNVSKDVMMSDKVGSDCESDGAHTFKSQMVERNKKGERGGAEFEDGELRDTLALAHSTVENQIADVKMKENVELAKSDAVNLQSLVFPGDHNSELSDLQPMTSGNIDEAGGDQIKVCITTSTDKLDMEDGSSGKMLPENVTELGTVERRSDSVTSEKSPDPTGRRDIQEDCQRELLGNEVADGWQVTGAIPGDEPADKIVEAISEEPNVSTVDRTEESVRGDSSTKDSNRITNKSRIITLSRSSNPESPPFRKRYIPGRLLPPQGGKERYSDFEGKRQVRGNRDEFYSNGPNKFAKDRIQDHSYRNSRSFTFGRGKMSGRFDSLHNEWDSNHDFTQEDYNGSDDYRVARRRHASSNTDTELESNGYGITPDGAPLSNGRRKASNDDLPSLRRPSMRRLSPGTRDVPANRGGIMMRRIPRNVSPSRGTDNDDSNLAGLRHGKKFMRDFPDDIVDAGFSPQTIYDGEMGGHLVRGNRNFSSVQRKGYPRMRSKSPVRSRTRSPGPWSSPRRRSPGGFPELTQRRTPAMYRMDRMVAPDHACFPDEMVARRRGSPTSVARRPNDMRELESGQEHIHPRFVNSNRSSPGRMFPRSARLESREREDSDEYVTRTGHSSRYHGDGSNDERRKFGEGRGVPRLFRPTSYNGDGENFRLHLNGGHRSFRLRPEGDTDFVERNNARERELNNAREREFDNRMKHQSLVASRRMREMTEEQDGNYRPGEQVWHDDGYNDESGPKRRRF